MKKILTVLLCLFTIPQVIAQEELNVTEDSIIKYKWYKQEKDDLYYPKKDYLDGYFEEPNNIMYSDYSIWNTDNCLLENENYFIEKETSLMYQKVSPSRYLKLTGFVYNNNIKVYSKNKEISYSIIINNSQKFILDLKKEYNTDSLWFYIDTNQIYDLELAYDQEFIIRTLSTHIDNKKMLLPDKTWINDKTHYTNVESLYIYDDNDFLKYKGKKTICRYREILTYRYKYKIIPYDDEYHQFIDGYQPNMLAYQVYYNGKLPEKEIIVNNEKIVSVPVPKVEYVYKEKECHSKTIAKTKYQTREIYKIPKYSYILIIFLLLIIILSIIKICRLKYLAKNVEHV